MGCQDKGNAFPDGQTALNLLYFSLVSRVQLEDTLNNGYLAKTAQEILAIMKNIGYSPVDTIAKAYDLVWSQSSCRTLHRIDR